DEIRPGEHVRGFLGDAGPRRTVLGIVHADACASAALDEDLMAGRCQLSDACRHQADPILVDLDLLGDTDTHGSLAPGEIANTQRLGARGRHRLAYYWLREGVLWQTQPTKYPQPADSCAYGASPLRSCHRQPAAGGRPHHQCPPR